MDLKIVYQSKKDIKFIGSYISCKNAAINPERFVGRGPSDKITENTKHPSIEILIEKKPELERLIVQKPHGKIDFEQYNGGVQGAHLRINAHSFPAND